MKTRTTQFARAGLPLAAAALALAACSGESRTGATEAAPATPAMVAGTQVRAQATRAVLDDLRSRLPPTLVEGYARRLAPLVAGRTLRMDEATALQQGGGAALPALIAGWTTEDGFALMAREWIATTLRASGTRGDMNLELPGNLAAHLVRNRRPHGELLTADYCVSDAGAKIACDTGAPYSAGVLTTRAFLANNASRFNLKRARTVLRTFACKDYPMPSAEQPPLARESLIPMFQVDQSPAGSANSFGNGFACYTCHSQFGAHAQPFVKFDIDGRWVAGATGLQAAGAEQGRSGNNTFASHLLAPGAAASEASQIFGRPVANLADSARVFAESDGFLTCSTRRLIGHTFGLPDAMVFTLPADIIDDIVAGARAREAAPSLAALAIEVFAHPSVVRSLDIAARTP